jgi:hypothetical protein
MSLGATTALAGCNEEDRTESAAEPSAAELPDSPPMAGPTPKPEPTTEVDDIEDEPRRFYGRVVTLAGEIESVRSNSVFELEGDDWLFPDELLVVTKSPVRLGANDELDDMDVIVTGKIVPMVVAEVERELGWDLEPQIEAEFENKPVLIATSIRAVEDVARWTEGGAEPQPSAMRPQGGEQPAGEQAGQPSGEQVTLAAFSKAPADNLGKTVQGEATVGKVLSDRAFWVNTDAPSGPVLMIVREDVPEHDMIDVKAGQRIRFKAQSHGPQDANALGGTLEADAEEAIKSMPAFLAAHHRDVEILDAPTDAPKG